jgi:hypothetical protein
MSALIPSPDERKSKDWTAPTPTQLSFRNLIDLRPIFRAFYKHNRSADAIEKLPEDVSWIKRAVQQFEAHRGKNVMLVLGFCPKGDETSCLTDRIVDCLSMEGQNPIIYLDLRKECRRQKDDSGCHSIDENEIEVLMACTGLELQIGQKEFGISFKSVVTFSGCWDGDRWNRICQAIKLEDVPHLHESRHLGWMKGNHLREFAESLSNTVMKEWTKEEIVLSMEKAGINAYNDKSRIPFRFVEAFQALVGGDEDGQGVLMEVRKEPRPLGRVLGKRKRDVADEVEVDKNMEPRPKTATGRIKTGTRCESCFKLHLKCDGGPPCNECVSRGKECKARTPKGMENGGDEGEWWKGGVKNDTGQERKEVESEVVKAPKRERKEGQKPPGRVRKSCLECYQSGRKCDRGNPCDQCKRLGKDCHPAGAA